VAPESSTSLNHRKCPDPAYGRVSMY